MALFFFIALPIIIVVSRNAFADDRRLIEYFASNPLHAELTEHLVSDRWSIDDIPLGHFGESLRAWRPRWRRGTSAEPGAAGWPWQLLHLDEGSGVAATAEQSRSNQQHDITEEVTAVSHWVRVAEDPSTPSIRRNLSGVPASIRRNLSAPELRRARSSPLYRGRRVAEGGRYSITESVKAMQKDALPILRRPRRWTDRAVQGKGPLYVALRHLPRDGDSRSGARFPGAERWSQARAVLIFKLRWCEVGPGERLRDETDTHVLGAFEPPEGGVPGSAPGRNQPASERTGSLDHYTLTVLQRATEGPNGQQEVGTGQLCLMLAPTESETVHKATWYVRGVDDPTTHYWRKLFLAHGARPPTPTLGGGPMGTFVARSASTVSPLALSALTGLQDEGDIARALAFDEPDADR